MSKNFYLFLPVQNKDDFLLDSSVLNWVYEDTNNELKLAQGLLHDAALAASGYYITIVLSGEDVLFLQAEVPGKNIQRVQQAVPYVLEDSVIDDVDELHFAINKSNSDNRYDVSVINKYYFESIIKQLEKSGIYADAMTADYLLNAENSLFFDGEKLLFNSEKVKFSSGVDSLNQINNETFINTKLKLIVCDKDESDGIDVISNDLDLEKSSCEEHPLLCLIKNYSGELKNNLLQGAYKKKKDWSNTSRKWLPVAALFLVWLVVQGGVFVFDYIDLNEKNKRLNIEITNIYKQSFPKSRRIIDAKAQMQQKLSQLRKRKGQSGRSFSNMLSASAGIFARSKGLIIKSLRYYDGRINLEIEIASLQALDKLKEQLQNEKGYQVEIQNASSGKETVTARLQIIGAAL